MLLETVPKIRAVRTDKLRGDPRAAADRWAGAGPAARSRPLPRRASTAARSRTRPASMSDRRMTRMLLDFTNGAAAAMLDGSGERKKLVQVREPQDAFPDSRTASCGGHRRGWRPSTTSASTSTRRDAGVGGRVGLREIDLRARGGCALYEGPRRASIILERGRRSPTRPFDKLRLGLRRR